MNGKTSEGEVKGEFETMAFRENAAGEIVMPADDGQWHVQQLCIFDLRNRTQSPQEIYGVQTASFRLTNFVPRTRARKKCIFHQHRPASLTPPSGVTLPPNRPAPSCFRNTPKAGIRTAFPLAGGRSAMMPSSANCVFMICAAPQPVTRSCPERTCRLSASCSGTGATGPPPVTPTPASLA